MGFGGGVSKPAIPSPPPTPAETGTLEAVRARTRDVLKRLRGRQSTLITSPDMLGTLMTKEQKLG